MALEKSLKNLKFDARMIEFNLKNGIITEAEYKEYLKQLPDSGNNSETLSLTEASSSSETQH